MERDLFSNDEVFNEIVEDEITFPIFVCNESRTQFTWYKNKYQFEQINLSEDNKSLRGSLLYGFNEHLHSIQYDLKIFIFTLLRVHTIITKEEYDSQFAKLITNREIFFEDSIVNEYVEHELSDRQMNVKHKYPRI